MQVENPRRLIAFLLLIAVALFAGYWFLLRSDSSSVDVQQYEKGMPALGQKIIDATSKQTRLKASMKANGKVTTETLITADGVATYSNGKLVQLQKGKNTYTYINSCYQKTVGTPAVSGIKSFVENSLPKGDDITYKANAAENGSLVGWKQLIPATKGIPNMTISGAVYTKGGDDRVVSATQTRNGQTAEIVFTYPASDALPKTPGNLC